MHRETERDRARKMTNLERNVVVLGIDVGNLWHAFWVFGLDEVYADSVIE